MNGQPPPASTSNGPKAASWVMMAPAVLIGVLWASVLLNLLGTAVGLVGLVIFIMLAAVLWRRTVEPNEHLE
jgi:membrane protein implicated in regulation of membrane protease activity